MNTAMKASDKLVERARYDSVAKVASEVPNFRSFAAYHVTPYEYYVKCLNRVIDHKSVVLEIGSGLGLFTKELVETQASVIASDISDACLKFLSESLDFPGNLETKQLDMESLNSDETK